MSSTSRSVTTCRTIRSSMALQSAASRTSKIRTPCPNFAYREDILVLVATDHNGEEMTLLVATDHRGIFQDLKKVMHANFLTITPVTTCIYSIRTIIIHPQTLLKGFFITQATY